MSRQVEMKITADNAQALQAFERLVAKGVEVGQKLEQAGKKGKVGFDESGDALVSGIKKGIGMILGAGGLLSAVTLVRDEFEKIKQLQSTAAATQITANAAFEQLRRNMIASTKSEIDEMETSLKRIAKNQNLPLSTIVLAGAEAISSGSGDPRQAVKSVETAARHLPDQPETIGMMSGALMDISGAMGIPAGEQTYGYLGYLTSGSRMTDPQQQALRIPKALTAFKSAGLDPREAGALFAGLTRATTDPFGRTATTAGKSIVERMKGTFEGGRLAELQEKFDPYKLDFGLSKNQFKEMKQLEMLKKAPKDFMGRLRFIQEHPELSEAGSIFDPSSFGEGITGSVRELFDPEGSVAKRVEDAYQNIPDQSQFGPSASRGLELSSEAPYAKEARLDRAFKSAAEQQQLRTQASGGIVREGIGNLLKGMPGLAIGDKLLKLQFEMQSRGGTRDLLESTQGVLQMEIARLETMGTAPKGPDIFDIISAPQALGLIDMRRPADVERDTRAAKRTRANANDAAQAIRDLQNVITPLLEGIENNSNDPKVTKKPASRKEEK